MNGQPEVAAVVVTYNRLELLERVLDALESQTYPVGRVYVIDNASTDGTSEYLASRRWKRPASVITARVNTGGAGGFTRGIEAAAAGGADMFWLMDDDTLPHPDALEKLVEAYARSTGMRGKAPSFACSQVLWSDGSLCEMNNPEPTWDWSRPLAAGGTWLDVQSCSFVSCLVSREAVRSVGLPYREYFIWYDDAEYTLRLSKWSPGVFVPESRVTHLLASNRGVNWGDVTADNIWKFEYGMRNQVSAAWSLRRPHIAVVLAENVIGQMRGSGVPAPLRLRLLRAACRGLFFHPKRRYLRS